MNMLRILPFCLATLLFPTLLTAQEIPSIAEATGGIEATDGFFPFYWDQQKGKVWLAIDKLDTEVLYVNALSGGLGSNDIGLDRNQLGDSRVVQFVRRGPKVLMLQPNYDYRAVSDNPEERRSVREAFARSVLWGFEVQAETGGTVLIDFTEFLLRDAHGVAGRLQRAGQGSFKVDPKRSAINPERTRNFPKNSEFDAWITFTGEAKGGYLRSVTPTSEAFTVAMHHSLVELPDDDYQPRVFDPRSGFYALGYHDYATPIDQPLMKRLITRHRLEKKNPGAAVSEPVEPIVYYLDRGAPEPIKSALIEGASWWNQAFEAAGYKDAFIVRELPPDADPLDVRYNVINWVHRSTRGWSYGSSVTDPRTGEIIKGHVLLGSLRVRQDFLIAQGLVDAYPDGTAPDPRLQEMALARLRQLSAHEVGHTLGIAHNFAASTNDRASVMDYPHPYVQLNDDGSLDFSEAYDVGIGAWDKRVILYGYQDFPEGTDQLGALQDILAENEALGLRYISDQDARPPHGAHPLAHLWDNGSSAIEELERLGRVRQAALASFDERQVPAGTPLATLENVLVPLFLAHRYQVEAVSKIIGGVNYTYAVRGGEGPANEPVADETQREAVAALVNTLAPGFLALPEKVIRLIPPQPIGYSRGRELFRVHTGLTFDPIGAAESSAHHTLTFLLNPQRLARMVEQHALDADRLAPEEMLAELFEQLAQRRGLSGYHAELARMTEKLAVQHLMQLAGDQQTMRQVAALAWHQLRELENSLEQRRFSNDTAEAAHVYYLQQQVRLFQQDPEAYELPEPPAMPDGSPIGCYRS